MKISDKMDLTAKKTSYLGLLFLLLLESINAVADTEVTIGCLKYSLSGYAATVSGFIEETLPENLVIPQEIEYNNLVFTVEAINKRAFSNCQKIKTIECPSTIKEIKSEYNNGAFLNCTNLEKVYFYGVENIGQCAFQNCSKLRVVDLGNQLKSINKGTFFNCSSLVYIVIPSTVTSIGGSDMSNLGAFEGCTLLRTVIFLSDKKVNGYFGYNNIGKFTTYVKSDFISWDNNIFDYCGSEPTLSYTNNMPAGFKVTSDNKNTSLYKNVGTYTLYIPFTFANDDMSFDVEIPYTYTINPVTLKAKVNDASRPYGDENPQFSSTYTGFVNNENENVITSHGSYSTTASSTSDIGTYSIQQTGATAQNYVFEYENGTLTINKAPLTMTANDKSMTYGNTIPTLDAKYEGLKNNETKPVWNNEPIITTTATSASKVGAYPITINDADAKNYQLTINNGTMTIIKAELTINADNKNRIYGDANPDFTLSYTGLKNNETVPEWEKQPVIETTADVKSSVGTYPISVKDAVAVNYNISAIDGTLTINKASIRVKPNDATRKYGEDNPKFELSYIGLRNNENVPEWTTAPVITTNATKASSVGEYAIEVTSAEARNYNLDNEVGILTITKAPLTVGVKNYSRKYGETNPTFELYYDGLLNGEATPEWTELPTITTDAETMSDVGEYEIAAIGGELKNYEAAEISSGVLTITTASLIIKANDANRLYYEDDPEFTFSCIGLVGNDDSSVLSKKPEITTTAIKNSNVGVYVIEISNAESKNYAMSYEKGQLTINKRQLTVSTNDYTRAYGEENPIFELNYTGFVNNENESVLLSMPKATTTATPNSDVGVYDIIIANGVAENYDFIYNSGKLTIEKAYQTLTWDQDFSEVKQYDQIELTASASSGLEITYTVEGDQVCSITKIGEKQYLDCAGEGEAVIVAIQEGNNNYWQTTKIYKPIVIKSSSGINTAVNSNDKNTKIYDVSGNRINKLQKGINILKLSNGKTKKVLIK